MISKAVLEQLVTHAEQAGVHQLVVGAIVRDGDSVLLLQRPEDDFMGGIFELPSGTVEPGETLDAALTREVAEETGLVVTDISDYIGSFDYTSDSKKKSRQFNFAVAVTATEPVRLTEHHGYLWAPLGGELPVTDTVSQLFHTYRNLRKV